MIQKKLENGSSFDERHVKLIIYQIFKGLEDIHSKSNVS